jgi:transposase-like protein
MEKKNIVCPYCGRQIPKEEKQETEEKTVFQIEGERPSLRNLNVKCPRCGNAKVWRAGRRLGSQGEDYQRVLCRTCGYRFTLKCDEPWSPEELDGVKCHNLGCQEIE